MARNKDMESKERSGIAEKVNSQFSFWKGHYKKSPSITDESVASNALRQTLHSRGLDAIGVKSGDLDSRTSEQVARELIQVAGSGLGDIIRAFNRGDLLERADYSDPRAQRIIVAARKILGGR